MDTGVTVWVQATDSIIASAGISMGNRKRIELYPEADIRENDLTAARTSLPATAGTIDPWSDSNGSVAKINSIDATVGYLVHIIVIGVLNNSNKVTVKGNLFTTDYLSKRLDAFIKNLTGTVVRSESVDAEEQKEA